MSQKMKGLKCKECERLYPTQAIHVCEYCFGPLEVDYNYDFIKRSLTHGKIESGPHTLWRYWDLLPVETDNVISIHEGMTPLFHAKRLGKELGLSNLFIKNDAVNPTYSFKDRVVSVALSRARELGLSLIHIWCVADIPGFFPF